MSYDLAFWKQTPTCSAFTSQIYAELLEQRAVDGLEAIPTAQIIKRIRQQFPSLNTDSGMTYWEGGERGNFEVHSSAQHVRFCCSQMSGDDMNILIDIAAEFECPLYDPQEDTRFD